MLKIKNKVKEFVSFVNILPNFNPDVDFKFTENGLFIKVIHVSGNSLCIFEIGKDFFDEYDIKQERIYTLHVDTLRKIIKNVSKQKEIVMNIKSEGLFIMNKKCEYKLNYFVGNEDSRPVPQLQNTMEWKVDSGDFFDNIDNCIEFSDVCKFINKDNKLTMVSKANLVDGNIKIKGDNTLLETDDYAYYDITYFQTINDIKNIFKEIKFGFKKDHPCVVEGDNEGIKFKWVLAPRIEDE